MLLTCPAIARFGGMNISRVDFLNRNPNPKHPRCDAVFFFAVVYNYQFHCIHPMRSIGGFP
jgi:hypothetical protein